MKDKNTEKNAGQNGQDSSKNDPKDSGVPNSASQGGEWSPVHSKRTAREQARQQRSNQRNDKTTGRSPGRHNGRSPRPHGGRRPAGRTNYRTPARSQASTPSPNKPTVIRNPYLKGNQSAPKIPHQSTSPSGPKPAPNTPPTIDRQGMDFEITTQEDGWKDDLSLQSEDEISQALRSQLKKGNIQSIEDSDDMDEGSESTPKTTTTSKPSDSPTKTTVTQPEPRPPAPLLGVWNKKEASKTGTQVDETVNSPDQEMDSDGSSTDLEGCRLFEWRVDVITHIPTNTSPIATMKAKVANIFQCLLNVDESVVLFPYLDSSERDGITTVDEIYNLTGTSLAHYADNDGFRSYPKAEVENCRLIFFLAANIEIAELLEKAKPELEGIRTKMFKRSLNCERIRRVGFLLYSNQSMDATKLGHELRKKLHTDWIAIKWRRAAARLDMFKSSYEKDSDGRAPFIPAALIIEASASVTRRVRMLLRQLYPLKLRTDRTTYPRSYPCAFVYSYNPDELQSQLETSKTAIKKAWEIQKLCCREYTRTIDDCLKDPSKVEHQIILPEGSFPSLRDTILSLTAPMDKDGFERPIFSACELEQTMIGSSVVLSFRKKFSAQANNVIDYLGAHVRLALNLPIAYVEHQFRRSHLFGLNDLEYNSEKGIVFMANMQQAEVDLDDIHQTIADFELNLDDVKIGWEDPHDEDFDDRSRLAQSVNTFGTKGVQAESIQDTVITTSKPSKAKRRRANKPDDLDQTMALTTPTSDSVSTLTSVQLPSWFQALTAAEQQTMVSVLLQNTVPPNRSAGPSDNEAGMEP